mmetsp:Transcript_25506/g.75794  ORF Transcript_25506/g.75794 Transcript_25506/m.75794 type:complete len:330 (-) Transcript_25506:2209-3198(-)
MCMREPQLATGQPGPTTVASCEVSEVPSRMRTVGTETYVAHCLYDMGSRSSPQVHSHISMIPIRKCCSRHETKRWSLASDSTDRAASKHSDASPTEQICARAVSMMRGASAARRRASGAAVRCPKSDDLSIWTPLTIGSLPRGMAPTCWRKGSRNQSAWKRTARKEGSSPTLDSPSAIGATDGIISRPWPSCSSSKLPMAPGQDCPPGPPAQSPLGNPPPPPLEKPPPPFWKPPGAGGRPQSPPPCCSCGRGGMGGMGGMPTPPLISGGRAPRMKAGLIWTDWPRMKISPCWSAAEAEAGRTKRQKACRARPSGGMRPRRCCLNLAPCR